MNSINHYLEVIAKEVKHIIGTLCSERMVLDDQLLPFKASSYYHHVRSGLLEEGGGREERERVEGMKDVRE